MITFVVCVLLLLLGYTLNTRVVESAFGISDAVTPAHALFDGVDFVPMNRWRLFFVELLNIAGLGPIFGALAGALWGPTVFLWITFGTIFIGSVYDYFAGMLGVHNKGIDISEVFGLFFGHGAQRVFQTIMIASLILICVVFTVGPAGLIAMLFAKAGLSDSLLVSIPFWSLLICAYYFCAGFLPIDKIIGKIYPFLGLLIFLMAFGVLASLMTEYSARIPEIWEGFGTNMHPKELPIFPFLFISVACGAVSGFHATQTTLAARCLKSERDARLVFAGSMYSEGFIALIWAAAGCGLYALVDGHTLELAALVSGGQAVAIYDVCIKTMGQGSAFLAVIGVILCPISTGDTCLRVARISVSQWVGFGTRNVKFRVLASFVLTCVCFVLTFVNFEVIWRYFAWGNQTFAACIFWAASVFMVRQGKSPWIVALPGALMTMVSASYFLLAPECLGGIIRLDYSVGMAIAGCITALISSLCLRKAYRERGIG